MTKFNFKKYAAIGCYILLVFLFLGCEQAELTFVKEKDDQQKISFQQMSVKVGKTSLLVEVASTPEQRRQGLMGRTHLDSDAGMLFVHPKPAILSFWMKDTHIPLSLGYFDASKILVQVLDMNPEPGIPDQELTAYPSQEKVKYVLEVNQGWFQRKNINVGDILDARDL